MQMSFKQWYLCNFWHIIGRCFVSKVNTLAPGLSSFNFIPSLAVGVFMLE